MDKKNMTAKALMKWKEMGDATVQKIVDSIRKHPEGTTLSVIIAETGISREAINQCLKRRKNMFTISYGLVDKHVRKKIFLKENKNE